MHALCLAPDQNPAPPITKDTHTTHSNAPPTTSLLPPHNQPHEQQDEAISITTPSTCMSAHPSPSLSSSPRPERHSTINASPANPLPAAPTKRRAFSVTDRGLFPRSSNSSSRHGFASSSSAQARRAMSSAFSSVSSRFMKSASIGGSTARSASGVTTTTTTHDDDAHADDHGAHDHDQQDPARNRMPGRNYSARLRVGSWQALRSKLPPVPPPLKAALRRPRGGSRNIRHASLPWQHGRVQYVSSSFALHGEDAGAISSYYHIIADGISAPFATPSGGGGSSSTDATPPRHCVSSAVIAQALVAHVEAVLEDLTNRNQTPLDAAALEHAITDAIRATRMQCYPHRTSRIAATLCVAYFDRWHSRVHTFSLGDCKTVVVRNGDVVFQTTATVREFNVPCVVNLEHALQATDYVVESFELRQDDLCLSFSDGVGDNVYRGELLAALQALHPDADADEEGGDGEEGEPTATRQAAREAKTLQEVCDQLVAQCVPPEQVAAVTNNTKSSSPRISSVTTVASDTDEPEADGDGEVDGANANTNGGGAKTEETELENELHANTTATTPTSGTAAMLRERLTSASQEDTDADSSNSNPASPDTTPTPPATSSSSSSSSSSVSSAAGSVRPFYPFATAAAYEYRRRVLRQRAHVPAADAAAFLVHEKQSAALLDLHDGRRVLDRQVLVAKANRRAHYSLTQLQRMARIRSLKPDDVTLYITQFS